MNHDKYHALRNAAEAAHNLGNSTALAAIVEGGDRIYKSIDWSEWSDEERVVYGIMTGIRLSHPEAKGRVFLPVKEAALCACILGDEKAVERIALIVWQDITGKGNRCP